MSESILLVEDEEKLARMVEMELKYEGYQVEKAFDGRSGLEKACSGEFDLILLDIMLPQLSGMEVLRRLRKESQVPVIMLTARDSVITGTWLSFLSRRRTSIPDSWGSMMSSRIRSKAPLRAFSRPLRPSKAFST